MLTRGSTARRGTALRVGALRIRVAAVPAAASVSPSVAGSDSIVLPCELVIVQVRARWRDPKRDARALGEERSFRRLFQLCQWDSGRSARRARVPFPSPPAVVRRVAGDVAATGRARKEERDRRQSQTSRDDRAAAGCFSLVRAELAGAAPCQTAAVMSGSARRTSRNRWRRRCRSRG